MKVKVPLYVAPSGGDVNTLFSVDWGQFAPPQGFYWDVQYKSPGASDWVFWKRVVRGGGATFKADHGSGVYQFRARTNKDQTRHHSDWSTPISITVTP